MDKNNSSSRSPWLSYWKTDLAGSHICYLSGEPGSLRELYNGLLPSVSTRLDYKRVHFRPRDVSSCCLIHQVFYEPRDYHLLVKMKSKQHKHLLSAQLHIEGPSIEAVAEVLVWLLNLPDSDFDTLQISNFPLTVSLLDSLKTENAATRDVLFNSERLLPPQAAAWVLFPQSSSLVLQEESFANRAACYAFIESLYILRRKARRKLDVYCMSSPFDEGWFPSKEQQGEVWSQLLRAMDRQSIDVLFLCNRALLLYPNIVLQAVGRHMQSESLILSDVTDASTIQRLLLSLRSNQNVKKVYLTQSDDEDISSDNGGELLLSVAVSLLQRNHALEHLLIRQDTDWRSLNQFLLYRTRLSPMLREICALSSQGSHHSVGVALSTVPPGRFQSSVIWLLLRSSLSELTGSLMER